MKKSNDISSHPKQPPFLGNGACGPVRQSEENFILKGFPSRCAPVRGHSRLEKQKMMNEKVYAK